MARLIAGLLNKPEKWTKDCLGRTKEGQPIFCFDLLRTTNARTGETEEIDFSAPAKSFSIYGAIVYCYEVDRREKVLDNLRVAIRAATGRNDNIALFNNRPETTFKDVSLVLRLAGV